MHGLPTLLVERVDWLHQLRVPQPMASKQLPHMLAFILLHVAIVVFLVRPRTGNPYRLGALLNVAQQVPVQELKPIVGIKTKKLEGKSPIHLACRSGLGSRQGFCAQPEAGRPVRR